MSPNETFYYLVNLAADAFHGSEVNSEQDRPHAALRVLVKELDNAALRWRESRLALMESEASNIREMIICARYGGIETLREAIEELGHTLLQSEGQIKSAQGRFY